MAEAFYVIYGNLFLYMRHRHISVKSTPLSKKEFLKEFSEDGYVEIDEKDLIILLINPEKKYAKLDSNMKALLRRYVSNEETEMLIITNISYSSDQHIIKVKNIIGGHEALINFRPYSIFMYDIPNHALSAKHTIVNRDDIKQDLNLVYLNVKELPKIYDHDSQATWIGARAGDIIEIERISPVAGITTVYREVISKVHTI